MVRDREASGDSPDPCPASPHTEAQPRRKSRVLTAVELRYASCLSVDDQRGADRIELPIDRLALINFGSGSER
jgi:hypothetical protein